MRKPSRPWLRVLAFGAAVVAGCGGDPEVVVTREQFGDAWPLAVNSAVVVCRDGGEAALLRLGVEEFALTEAARALGYRAASEIPGATGTAPDLEPLRSVCELAVAEGP
jgi:hypothetical protein